MGKSRTQLSIAAALVATGSLLTWGLLSGASGSEFSHAGNRAPSATECPYDNSLGGCRERLSICVEAPSALQGRAITAVEDALRRMEAEAAGRQLTIEWLRGWRVVAGCPAPPTPGGNERRFVETASEHRIFVYVPGNRAANVPGDRPFDRFEAEYTCYGDTCAGATAGLRVWSLDPDDVRAGLINALGLVQLLLPPDWTPPWNDEQYGPEDRELR